jgi:hypothetical protein
VNRYRVTLTPDGRKFGILDRELYDYCGIPDGDGAVIPLEWTIKPAAEAWLQRCYRLWQAWEDNGAGVPPRKWRPRPEAVSPFNHGRSTI